MYSLKSGNIGKIIIENLRILRRLVSSSLILSDLYVDSVSVCVDGWWVGECMCVCGGGEECEPVYIIRMQMKICKYFPDFVDNQVIPSVPTATNGLCRKREMFVIIKQFM